MGLNIWINEPSWRAFFPLIRSSAFWFRSLWCATPTCIPTDWNRNQKMAICQKMTFYIVTYSLTVFSSFLLNQPETKYLYIITLSTAEKKYMKLTMIQFICAYKMNIRRFVSVCYYFFSLFSFSVSVASSKYSRKWCFLYTHWSRKKRITTQSTGILFHAEK